MRLKHKAVLFDLDGTLLNTLEDLTDSMNAALRQLGLPARSAEECGLFVGEGREVFAYRSLPEARRDEKTVALCAKLMTEHYDHNWATKTRPYDGVEELLEGLASRDIATAVLSNKYDQAVKRMVTHFFGHFRFELVLGARPKTPNKPDPTTALSIASSLNMAPCEFLYLGDSGIDMQTAKAAGMYAAGALWGFRPAEELSANGADALVEHPTHLLGLL
jgi:phosphoglycolate phosphatase